MGIIITILIGALCGWLAGKIFKGGGLGALLNIIVGVLGGALGSWLLGGIIGNGIIGQIIMGTVGAILILWICSLISGKK